jgi:large conductance mechanosensitive channel
MPPIGLILARVDFANLFWDLSGTHHATLDEAKKAGVATINYGILINNVIDFIIVAFVIFLVVRQANKMRQQPATIPNTKECPYCASAIPLKAKRCPNCTSQLE